MQTDSKDLHVQPKSWDVYAIKFKDQDVLPQETLQLSFML